MVWSPRSPTAIATVSARPLPESVNGLPKRPLRRSIARTIRRVAPVLVLVTSIQAISAVPRLLAAIWAWPTTGRGDERAGGAEAAGERAERDVEAVADGAGRAGAAGNALLGERDRLGAGEGREADEAVGRGMLGRERPARARGWPSPRRRSRRCRRCPATASRRRACRRSRSRSAAGRRRCGVPRRSAGADHVAAPAAGRRRRARQDEAGGGGRGACAPRTYAACPEVAALHRGTIRTALSRSVVPRRERRGGRHTRRRCASRSQPTSGRASPTRSPRR